MAKNRILIAEDDNGISMAVSLNLELSGYEYTVFENGKETAQHLAQDHSYDLALIDVMLPGLDGFKLLEHVKKYNIPSVFLTAKTDVYSRVRGLKGGAEDYIVKPFEMLELLVRIEKILERTGKLASVLRYRDITIDLAARTVTQAGERIALQPLEFDLLAKLVKFKNCTLTRERLLNEVWGIDFAGGTRTVDIHVAHIRKKLGLSDAITAVSKAGYRLEE